MHYDNYINVQLLCKNPMRDFWRTLDNEQAHIRVGQWKLFIEIKRATTTRDYYIMPKSSCDVM